VPWLLRAFNDAQSSSDPQLAALAADPRVVEAMRRLGAWDETTPTGIPQGYDASDVNGHLQQPTSQEIRNSVAATIYAAWRSRAVTSIIDGALGSLPVPDGAEALAGLRHLLDTWSTGHGVGASGIDFFAAAGIAQPSVARDYRLLTALSSGLDMLAGPAFDAAFHQSTDQSHYRWGLLHRLVLSHPLGGPFSVPTAFGQFPSPLPKLTGIPVDGGFDTVDAATHNVRASSSDGFMFGSGPARRFIASPIGLEMFARSALPGGTSALPDSPWYLNLLRPYLTNDYYQARLG
jgi:penicillin G amidase